MEGTIFSLIPPLVAIVLCILLREAILALFAGIFVGALFIFGWANPLTSFFSAVDEIILKSFINPDHAITIFFTVLTGGLTEILNRSDVARNTIRHLVSTVKQRWKASVLIWCSGFLFFVDDYANCLIVGNTYRKLVDGLKISREKLAYLVDTTSAPIASLALISTWIGIELSLIEDSLITAGVQDYTPYGLFIASIPYRFYPVLAIFFSLMVCVMQRDIGPMVRAERLALNTEPEEEPTSVDEKDTRTTKRSLLVFLPLLTLMLSSFTFLGWSGYSNGGVIDMAHPWSTIISVFGEADPYRSLLWATMVSTVVAFFVHLVILKEPFRQVNTNWLAGLRVMFTICLILTLAWSIGDVCKRMETGTYVASLLGEDFDPKLLPFFTFLFAGLISFATGTSYGTMSIMMPIALPLAVQLAGTDHTILCGVTGSVLGGAIFGDHCSPLSDTTILSSGSSGCSVTSHVNTQLPYALIVAAVSSVCLLIIPYAGFSVFALLAISLVVLMVILRLLGKKPTVSVPETPVE